MREPAFCDRVLWKSVYESDVELLSYDAAHDLMTSDHSPVYASFNVKVLVILIIKLILLG